MPLPPSLSSNLGSEVSSLRGLPPQQSNLNSPCHSTPSPQFIYILNFHSPPPATSHVGFRSHSLPQTITFLWMGASSAWLTVLLPVWVTVSGSEVGTHSLFVTNYKGITLDALYRMPIDQGVRQGNQLGYCCDSLGETLE